MCISTYMYVHVHMHRCVYTYIQWTTRTSVTVRRGVRCSVVVWGCGLGFGFKRASWEQSDNDRPQGGPAPHPTLS